MDTQIGPSIILGLTALIISWFYSRRASKREADKMNKELFTEFNARYDKLNDSLTIIEAYFKDFEKFKVLEIEDKDRYKKLKQDVIDFFNLCAEEYYWNKKKRIDPKIWQAWHAGMNYWFHNVPTVKKLWEIETQTAGIESYYLNGSEGFFVEKPFTKP